MRAHARAKLNQRFMNSLVEMGFPKAKAELALLETGNSNVEVAIEWLLQVLTPLWHRHREQHACAHHPQLDMSKHRANVLLAPVHEYNLHRAVDRSMKTKRMRLFCDMTTRLRSKLQHSNHAFCRPQATKRKSPKLPRSGRWWMAPTLQPRRQQ